MGWRTMSFDAVREKRGVYEQEINWLGSLAYLGNNLGSL
jgi:hypothetical protein